MFSHLYYRASCRAFTNGALFGGALVYAYNGYKELKATEIKINETRQKILEDLTQMNKKLQAYAINEHKNISIQVQLQELKDEQQKLVENGEHFSTEFLAHQVASCATIVCLADDTSNQDNLERSMRKCIEAQIEPCIRALYDNKETYKALLGLAKEIDNAGAGDNSLE